MSDTTKATPLLQVVFQGAGTVVVGNGFSKLCFVTVELSLAALLGAAGYGLFAIALALLLVGSHLCLVGINFGVIQLLAIFPEAGKGHQLVSVIRSALLTTGAIGLAVGVGMAFGAPVIAQSVFNTPELAPALLIVAIALPFETMNQCLSAVFRGLRQFRRHVITLDLIRNVVLVAGLPIVFWLRSDSTAVFGILLVGSVLGTVYGFVTLGRQFALTKNVGDDFPVLKELISFSYPLFFWEILQTSSSRLFVVVSGIFLVPAEVGVLALVIRMVTLLSFPQSAINMSAPVEFARLNFLGDLPSLNRLFQAVCLALALISFAVSLPLFVDPDLVLRLVGHEYAGFGWALALLLAVKLLNVSSGPVGQLLIACRKRHHMLMLTAIEATLQFSLVVPAMWLYGLPGAVCAEAARLVLYVLVRQIVLYRVLSVYGVTWTFLAVFSAGMVACVAGKAASGMIGHGGIDSWLAGTILGLIVLAVLGSGALLSAPEVRRELLRQLRRRRHGEAAEEPAE